MKTAHALAEEINQTYCTGAMWLYSIPARGGSRCNHCSNCGSRNNEVLVELNSDQNFRLCSKCIDNARALVNEFNRRKTALQEDTPLKTWTKTQPLDLP